MKAIIFINTQAAGSSRDALKIAEKLGYYTILFTDRQRFIKNKKNFPDVKIMEYHDLFNREELKAAVNRIMSKKYEVEAIVSFVDAYCGIASYLSEQYGLNNFSTEAILKMEDKILSRNALSNSSYSPFYYIANENNKISREIVKDHFPLIIKSPNSAGSRDVYAVDNYTDLKVGIGKLYEKSKSEEILIEEYLDGEQYLVENLVYDGEVHIIAVIHQIIEYVNGHFIVVGYSLITDRDSSFYEKLTSAVKDIIQLHGMEKGACHLEMRYVKDSWKIIEVNPRISGGAMNSFIKIAYGINLVEETLKLSLGQTPDIKPKHTLNAFIKYIISNKNDTLYNITGKNQALGSKGVKEVFIRVKKGSYVHIPRSLGDRCAYVIAVGKSQNDAEKNAKRAADKIKFIFAHR